MTLRNRFLITAAVLCHLLLVPPLVTSQLPPVNAATTHAGAPEKSATAQATPCALAAAAQKEKGENVDTICAIQQEEEGSVYKLHGAVEIYYENYVLRADEATYNSDTKEVTATGHFALDGGPNDDHIRASHGTYNLDLETGRFYDVTGTTGLRFRGNQVILTSTAPFAFTGRIVDKTSPEHYLVYDGTITTCELPHPKWEFDARKISVDVGGNAKIYRSNFLLHGIPDSLFSVRDPPGGERVAAIRVSAAFGGSVFDQGQRGGRRLLLGHQPHDGRHHRRRVLVSAGLVAAGRVSGYAQLNTRTWT